jgi:epoxyqueuosine reductase
MTPDAKTQLVKSLAREIGFDLVGVARAAPLPRARYYREWIARGYGGTLDYLRRNIDIRADPRRMVAGARSVICVALNYKRADGFLPASAAVEPGASDRALVDAENAAGRIAQYARGRDYHVVMRRMLRELTRRLHAGLDESFEARVCVDTAPLLERELAAAAGLGWIGRNTCLLNAALGSYLFLGEIVTSLELREDGPVGEQCGRCRRCLDACPTCAFIGPYELNASRCVSYLTIEYRGVIDAGLNRSIGTRVFGCDVCQQVCPYNARAPLGKHAETIRHQLPDSVNLLYLLKISAEEHRAWLRGTAASRATLPMWRRNALIALVNATGGAHVVAQVLAKPGTLCDPVFQETARRLIG